MASIIRILHNEENDCQYKPPDIVKPRMGWICRSDEGGRNECSMFDGKIC